MHDHYGEREVRELPPPPPWRQAVGVGIVIMGLAMGTGELILWPHLVTKHGLGLLWAAVLGITFQYFINQEVARHALATGESFFTSSSRIFRWFAPFWLLAVVLLYVWPGWAGAIGTTLRELTGFGNYLGWAWASLGLVLLLTYLGRVAYTVLERSLKIIVPTFFILLVITSVLNLSAENLRELLAGVTRVGFIPDGVDIAVLLGAIVFAGAGGLLNLCVSLWYRDKQSGMGRYAGRIMNPITGKVEAVSFRGYRFDLTPEHLSRWRAWMRFVKIDQGVIFWFLGLVTLLLLSVNAYASLVPKGLVPEGLNVAVVQAHIFGDQWGPAGFTLFLVMAFLMLFSVMWTVIDAFTRIASDILYVNAHAGPFAHRLRILRNVSLHHLYYGLISVLVIVSGLLLPLEQPLVLLTVSAVLGGLTMAIYTPVLLYLNNARLPRPLRPGWFSNLMLAAAALFYAAFAVYLAIFYLT
ncbi:MAG: Nramp family divalent metal transporter [Candidatus Jorgensenbacteria bacterium]